MMKLARATLISIAAAHLALCEAVMLGWTEVRYLGGLVVLTAGFTFAAAAVTIASVLHEIDERERRRSG